MYLLYSLRKSKYNKIISFLYVTSECGIIYPILKIIFFERLFQFFQNKIIVFFYKNSMIVQEYNKFRLV